MRRREFITFVGVVAVWLLAPHDATAQPADRMRRIAMLSGFAATDPEAQARVAALQQGLKELGWTEGRNVSIEFRWGTGGAEQMRKFAREQMRGQWGQHGRTAGPAKGTGQPTTRGGYALAV